METIDWQRWYDGGDFSNDWFSKRIPHWLKVLAPYRNRVRDILEVGSWEGRSAIFFCRFFDNARLTCVDTFAGSANHRADPVNYANVLAELESRFDRNTAAFVPRIEKIKRRSAAALDELADAGRGFDLVFIDASHRRQDVLADTVLAWPLVRTGGLLIWDDVLFGRDLPETERPEGAIDLFCSAFSYCMQVLRRDADMIVEKHAEWPRASTAGR